MFTPLAGRSVVVTGGSKGIGKGIARVFVRAGANVLLAARDEAGLVRRSRQHDEILLRRGLIALDDLADRPRRVDDRGAGRIGHE